jgi:hypothetical protein
MAKEKESLLLKVLLAYSVLIAVCSQLGHLTLIWMIEGRPLFSPTIVSLHNNNPAELSS